MPKALQQGELKFWGELCSYIDHVKDSAGRHQVVDREVVLLVAR
jgi:hypothetical protein